MFIMRSLRCIGEILVCGRYGALYDASAAKYTDHLDNSNSMDEDFLGNGVGSFASQSKSVQGKKALRTVIDQLKYKMRFGLMTFNVSGVSACYIHNSPYFASYDPKSYCPNAPPECVQYAQTGDLGAKNTCNTTCRSANPSFDAGYLDEIITNYAIGSEPRNRYSSLVFPKTQRSVNPTDPSNYIYYKNAYPFYDGSNDGYSLLLFSWI